MFDGEGDVPRTETADGTKHAYSEEEDEAQDDDLGRWRVVWPGPCQLRQGVA